MQQTNPASFVWKGWKGTKHGLTYVTHSCWWHFHSSNILLPASNSPKMSLLANSMVRSCQDLGCQMCLKKKSDTSQVANNNNNNIIIIIIISIMIIIIIIFIIIIIIIIGIIVITVLCLWLPAPTSTSTVPHQDLREQIKTWTPETQETSSPKKKNSLLETEEWSSFC